LGFASFLKYTVIAVLVHHLFLFYAEAFSFGGFFTLCFGAFLAVFSRL
jgi:hypothetical protein